MKKIDYIACMGRDSEFAELQHVYPDFGFDVRQRVGVNVRVVRFHTKG